MEVHTPSSLLSLNCSLKGDFDDAKEKFIEQWVESAAATQASHEAKGRTSEPNLLLRPTSIHEQKSNHSFLSARDIKAKLETCSFSNHALIDEPEAPAITPKDKPKLPPSLPKVLKEPPTIIVEIKPAPVDTTKTSKTLTESNEVQLLTAKQIKEKIERCNLGLYGTLCDDAETFPSEPKPMPAPIPTPMPMPKSPINSVAPKSPKDEVKAQNELDIPLVQVKPLTSCGSTSSLTAQEIKARNQNGSLGFYGIFDNKPANIPISHDSSLRLETKSECFNVSHPSTPRSIASHNELKKVMDRQPEAHNAELTARQIKTKILSSTFDRPSKFINQKGDLKLDCSYSTEAKQPKLSETNSQTQQQQAQPQPQPQPQQQPQPQPQQTAIPQVRTQVNDKASQTSKELAFFEKPADASCCSLSVTSVPEGKKEQKVQESVSSLRCNRSRMHTSFWDRLKEEEELPREPRRIPKRSDPNATCPAAAVPAAASDVSVATTSSRYLVQHLTAKEIRAKNERSSLAYF